MADGAPKKRPKRLHGDISIPIPTSKYPPPSHMPRYVRGAAPAPGKISLVPPDDGTGYIIDKVTLPAGPLLDPGAQRRLYYIVGWRDIPMARVAIECSRALEYVSPRRIEDWEYADLLAREAAAEAAAAEAARNAPARKKAGRPTKNRLLSGEPGAEEGDMLDMPPLTRGISLSTPRKPRILLPETVESILEGSDDEVGMGLAEDNLGSGVEYGFEGEAGSHYEFDEGMDGQAGEQETEDDMLQRVLLEEAEMNDFADKPEDDYDELGLDRKTGRTGISRLGPQLHEELERQRLPARPAESKRLSYSQIPQPPHQTHGDGSRRTPPASAAANPKPKVAGRGTGRWPKGAKASDSSRSGARSLPPTRVLDRIKLRKNAEAGAGLSKPLAAAPWSSVAHGSTASTITKPPSNSGASSKAQSATVASHVRFAASRDATKISKIPSHGRTATQTPVPLPSYAANRAPRAGVEQPTNDGARDGNHKGESIQPPQAQPVVADDATFEVERLEAVKTLTLDGVPVRYFRVRWKGDWPPDQNPSWEPEENIDPATVKRFLKSNNKKTGGAEGEARESAMSAESSITKHAAADRTSNSKPRVPSRPNSRGRDSNDVFRGPRTQTKLKDWFKPRPVTVEAASREADRRQSTSDRPWSQQAGPSNDGVPEVIELDEDDSDSQSSTSEDALAAPDSGGASGTRRHPAGGSGAASSVSRFQPGMGVEVKKPMLPPAVRESLSRSFAR